MEALTFGEQVKIILGRKGMTIKELAETIEERTGKKMSRQNLTQRLGRDNFQEQDMRMIADILDCPFYLSILSGESVSVQSMTEKESSEEDKTAQPVAAEGDRAAERDMTIGELYKMHEELSALEENAQKATLLSETKPVKQDIHKNAASEKHAGGGIFLRKKGSAAGGETVGFEKTADSEKANGTGEAAGFGGTVDSGEPTGFGNTTSPGTTKGFGNTMDSGETTGFGETVNSRETIGLGDAADSGETTGFGNTADSGKTTGFGNTTSTGETTGFGNTASSGETTGFENTASSGKATGFGNAASSGKTTVSVETATGFGKTEAPEQGQTNGQRADYGETPGFQDGFSDFEPVIKHDDAEEDLELGDVNPYTGREFQTNSVRMHPSRIGYVQVYDRSTHRWTDMTEWAFLGYQERKKALLGKRYEPPIYLD